MKPYYVVGHKNPDCDAIVSAIAYAALKRKLGIDAEARAQGTANPETLFLLKKWHLINQANRQTLQQILPQI